MSNPTSNVTLRQVADIVTRDVVSIAPDMDLQAPRSRSMHLANSAVRSADSDQPAPASTTQLALIRSLVDEVARCTRSDLQADAICAQLEEEVARLRALLRMKPSEPPPSATRLRA
jgi:hypothetical protein